MDDRLKKRLVGATVLVSLVVIFVPMLFEDRDAENSEFEMEIPPRPSPLETSLPDLLPPDHESLAIPPTTDKGSGGAIPTPIDLQPRAVTEKKPLTPDPVVKSQEQPKPPIVTEKQPPAPKPVVESQEQRKPPEISHKIREQASPTAWVLQTGSFSSRKNADRLVKRLRAKKIPAFHQEAVVKGKTVYRVRVGPELDRKQAESLVKRIKKEFKLNSRVIRYP